MHWRTLVVLALLSTVLAQKTRTTGKTDADGTESGKQGDKEAGDGQKRAEDEGRTRMSKRERPSCTAGSLPDNLSDSVKKLIIGVVEKTVEIDDIFPVLDVVPFICVLPILQQIRVNVYTFQEANAELVLCKSRGNKMIIQHMSAVIKASFSAEIYCKVLTDVNADAECEESHAIVKTLQVAECGYDGLSAEDIIALKPDTIRKYLVDIGDDGVDKFFEEMGDMFKSNNALIDSLPCQKVQILARWVRKRYFPEDLSELDTSVGSDFWHTAVLLPFLEAEVCKTIGFKEILGEVEAVSALDFRCEKKKEKSKSKAKKKKENMLRDLPVLAAEAASRVIERAKRDPAHNLPCKLSCGTILIITLMTGMEDATEEEKEKIKSLENLQLCQPLDDVLKRAKPGLCSSVTAEVVDAASDGPSRGMSRLAKQCKPKKELKSMTKSDLKSMGCAAAAMKGIQNIPKDQLCDQTYLEETLAPCLDVIGANREKIMRKCKSDLSVEQLQAMGAAAVYAGKEQLRKLGKNLKKEKADEVEKGLRDMPKARRKAIAFQIAKEADPKDLMGNKELAKAIPLKKLKEALKDTNVADLLKEVSTEGLSKAQKAELLKQHLKETNKGSPDKLTAEDVKGMQTLPEGFPPGQLRKFDLSMRKEVLGEVCKLDGFVGRQSEAVGEEMMDSLSDINEENPLDVLSEDEVVSLQGDCLAVVTAGSLKNASRILRRLACQRLGSQPRLKCLLNRKRRQRFASICADKDDVDADDDESNPVRNAAALLADAPVEEIKKIPAADLPDLLQQFRPFRCLRREIRDAIIAKLDSSLSAEDMKNPEKLALLADFAFVVKTGEHNNAAAELSLYVSVENTGSDDNAARNVHCCQGEMDDEERQASQRFADIVAAAQAKVIAATAADDNTGKRRKKRAGETVTCQDISDMQYSSVDAARINALSEDEFAECIAPLGAFDWHKNDRGDLANDIMKRIRNDFESLCEFDSEMLTDLGSLAQALEINEINCLKNFAGVSNLGGYSFYSDEQLSKFAKKYMTSNSKGGAKDLVASDLAEMGHFVCGLTKDDIKAIPVTVYSESSSVIGQLESCTEEALEAWAAHAVAHFGAVSTWDHSIFREAGILLAGLSTDDLGDADTDDVIGWTADGLRNMNPTKINELDPALLRALDRVQAYSIYEEQMEFLDSESLDALYYARDGFDGSTAKKADRSADDADGDNKDGNSAGREQLFMGVFGVMLSLLIGQLIQ